MTPVCTVAGCDQPVRDAYCCKGCAYRLSRWLGDVPALARELDLTLSRQSRQGGRVGSRNAETSLPWDQRASEATFNLRTVLVANVRMLAEDGKAWPADTLADMAVWLLAQVETIRHHQAVDEVVDEVRFAVEEARRVIDARPSLWYAGRCDAAIADPAARSPSTTGKVCDADLYARLTEMVITCRTCHATYDVEQRRRELLAAADGQLATATEASRFLSAYGEPVASERIRQWASRGRIIAHGLDPMGRPTYLVGDLRDLAAAEPARREQRAS